MGRGGSALGNTIVIFNASPRKIRTMEDFFRYLQSKILGIVHGSANDIGDAEKNRDLCEKAYNLGRMLVY